VHLVRGVEPSTPKTQRRGGDGEESDALQDLCAAERVSVAWTGEAWKMLAMTARAAPGTSVAKSLLTLARPSDSSAAPQHLRPRPDTVAVHFAPLLRGHAQFRGGIIAKNIISSLRDSHPFRSVSHRRDGHVPLSSLVFGDDFLLRLRRQLRHEVQLGPFPINYLIKLFLVFVN
jgi:hypothetical protein